MLQRLNNKIEKMDKKQEAIMVFFLSFLMVFLVTVGMGTITSGYHLVDDHEFLEWYYNMKWEGKGVFELVKEWIINDLSWRYEPLYYTNRILSCALFGMNITGYSILKAAEIVVACIFLYYCGRLMGGKKVYSFLFAVTSLVGYQSVIWWKLGPQEAQCTLLFSIGFYCILKWLSNDKIVWAVSGMIAFLCMCHYKESFILLVPFLMLYVLYYDLVKEDKALNWSRIGQCIKNRLWYYLIMGIVFTAIILFIVFYVGVNDYDKVGLNASVSLQTYVEVQRNAFSKDLKWYKRFGIVFILILLTYWEDLKKMWKEILLMVVFLLPQFVIFGQTGILERYMLPSTIAFSMFFMIMVPKQNILSGKRKMLYHFCILLLLLAHGRVALREADYFRYRGESVTKMLEAVKEMSQGQAKILSCLRPNEEGNLTIYYWMADYGYDNVYYWTEEEKVINQICDINLLHTYSEKQLEEQNFDDMDIIVMYNKEDRHWCYEPTLDLSDFEEMRCGTLTVYVRNGCGIEPRDLTVDGLRINF